jgi:hypothetical protein
MSSIAMYSCPNIIRIKSWMRWEQNVAGMGKKRNAWRVSLGKHERERARGGY